MSENNIFSWIAFIAQVFSAILAMLFAVAFLVILFEKSSEIASVRVAFAGLATSVLIFCIATGNPE